jgi:putative DNA methylase
LPKAGKGSTLQLFRYAIKGEYIQSQAKINGIKSHLIAIVADAGRGRIYLPANSQHSKVIEQAKPSWYPEDLLSTHPQYMGAPRYGMTRFCDLFTPRQLTAMGALSDLILNISRDVINDARNANLTETDAKNYAGAVTTFLALALDRCADFNNSLSTWKPSGQQQMLLFTRQAIPMVWDYAEAKLLGNKAICWHNAVDLTVNAIKSIPISNFKGGYSSQTDAAEADCSTHGLLVSTDPPYYDNIPYSDLSDFFYVWLRRTIKEQYPSLFSTVLTPKNPELVASSIRYDGNLIAAKEHFEFGFRKTFTSLREKIDSRFPLTVYYAFKQEDESSENVGENSKYDGNSYDNVDLTTGWETLLKALLGSGFQITATWPVSASQAWRMRTMGSNALASYIVLACRVRPNSAPQCTRRDFINILKREMKPALKKLQKSNIAPVDMAQAAIGPGREFFPDFPKFLKRMVHR